MGDEYNPHGMSLNVGEGSEQMPPVVVSVINMKGGVGKSTITNLLGIHALGRGLNVLAVDLDPQANLSQSFMRGGYRQFLADKSPSIVEVFQGYSPPSGTVGVPQPVEPEDVAIRYFPITLAVFASPNLGGIPPLANSDRLAPICDSYPQDSIFRII